MSESHLNNRIDDNSSLLDENLISKDDLKRYDIETLIQKAGGFGRLQWLLLIYAIFAAQGINYFMYNFAYLELMPSIL